MEVNAKLKELEDEFKVLKAEIRNVLLDIREVILDRTNPLGEEHESAHLTLDLNTTARAMAAEAASHEAMRANDAASNIDGGELPDDADGQPVSLLTTDEHADGASETVVAQSEEAGSEAEAAAAPEAAGEPAETAPAPKVIRRSPSADPAAFQPEEQLPMEIPPMFQAYQANVPPLSGNISISSWLTAALEAVGPQELERIITIHRLWGNLPSNISRALANLQEMLQETEDTEPPWLKVMQELDRLAAL
jgi:hypothetical protein